MAKDPSALLLVHGQHHLVFELALALNHPTDKVKKLPDQFVLQARSIKDNGRGQKYAALRDIAVSLAVNAQDVRGCGVLVMRGELQPDETSLWLGYRPSAGTEPLIPIFEHLPFKFQIVAWRPDSGNRDERDKARAVGWIDVLSPFQAHGKWQIGHAFCKKGNYPIVFLWRCEIPAYFEMHSHVESNHCSTLPAAWVHGWENRIKDSVEVDHIVGKQEIGYDLQDWIAKRSFALGPEAGRIGAMPTNKIAEQFAKDLGGAEFPSLFPFLAQDADLIGCLMPMDMEYMHFLGYYGVPISKEVISTESETGKTSMVRWYCWNKIWESESNNPEDSINVRKYTRTPPSSHGEVWKWMEEEEQDKYETWPKQRKSNIPLFKSKSGYKNVKCLPLFHFEPRRYTVQASADEDGHWNLTQVLRQPVQAPTNTGKDFFFGFKLYTALGWAPMDPFLRDPLERFYQHCEINQIPILNHGTPGGYYTHDRRHYYDLLDAAKKIGDGKGDLEKAGWLAQFAREVPGPDGQWLTPQEVPDKIWWFTHHYVSARAWKPVLVRFPMLRLCLAHFGDSDHLLTNSWDKRQSREPRSTYRDLQIAFDGDKIDLLRTHRFLYDLLDLVQPTNRVYVDLSYVILDKRNAGNFQKLFDWARIHKPILLERILWGTDWPLIGGQDPVKATGERNLLRGYARAFREALPDMPADFYVRACFLNPLQYFDLHRIRTLLTEKHSISSIWDWVKDLNPLMFEQTFQGDKLEIFYQHHPSIVKKLKT